MADDKGYIQPGYRTITPYLYGGQGLIDFLIDVFGAEVLHGGDVAADGSSHNEVMIGDSRVDFGSGYFADKSMASALWVYVPDVDATFVKALSVGAKAVREPADMTWGDRVGGVRDAYGNTWWIATHTPPK
ncbi:MAG TPA: VOC family protein [Candidatus Binataceae bacterium]|nr:VOC family protein [Candidatus Binataceae bacterium]